MRASDVYALIWLAAAALVFLSFVLLVAVLLV